MKKKKITGTSHYCEHWGLYASSVDPDEDKCPPELWSFLVCVCMGWGWRQGCELDISSHTQFAGILFCLHLSSEDLKVTNLKQKSSTSLSGLLAFDKVCPGWHFSIWWQSVVECTTSPTADWVLPEEGLVL